MSSIIVSSLRFGRLLAGDDDYTDDDDVQYGYNDDATTSAAAVVDSYNVPYYNYNPSDANTTVSWWYALLQGIDGNSTHSDLKPVEDVTSDAIMATLLFNVFVCLTLLVLYEVLRKWMPAVYARRLLQDRDIRGEGPIEIRTPSGEALERTGLQMSGDNNGVNYEALGDVNSNASATEGVPHTAPKDATTNRNTDTPDESSSTASSTHATHMFDWVVPVYSASWKTIRHTAGLDAYVFLRYIRMNLKITSVAGFWAACILWPLYATGGGGQKGFYYFSMANVQQADSLRIWFPTVFVYAFTAYCMFVIHQEYGHYMELRMDFLGAGTEALPDSRSQSMRALNLPTFEDEQGEAEGSKLWTQHRYSLMVEKIPEELRSNTALAQYFEEIFPGKVHSACVVMNIPDLQTISNRRLRVTRRLEKSIAHFHATGQRPRHVVGRPRIRCCNIESSPVDINLCLRKQNQQTAPAQLVLERAPEKGEVVDSISYYTRDLAECNRALAALQAEKSRLAETGARASDEREHEWYAKPLAMAKEKAKAAAEGLREEFELHPDDALEGGSPLFGREDRRDNEVLGPYGSFDSDTQKQARLVDNDHLTQPQTGEEPRDTIPHRSRSHAFFRTLMWRLGVDFLAHGLEQLRDRTDVVVDSVSKPLMSSTGFVTFNGLAPVTISTSAPLTFKSLPVEVVVAPEPRDIVWPNAHLDRELSTGREFLANILLSLGVLLWSVPLTIIQAWAKVEKVSLIPGFAWISKINGGKYMPLINGYLPVLALLGLILLLPLLFGLVATKYEKRKTRSEIQESIVGRYFYYQLANIYITVTAGSLWISLAEIINHPQFLLEILGHSLPKVAGYFISLLITKIFAGLPLVMLRVGALSRLIFLRLCFKDEKLTQKELDTVYRKQPILYGWEYPTQFLVIIICFTYACISPIVLPFGAVYFFCALMVYKKQALYVYTPTYESGGRLFPQACSKTLFALLLSQLTFIGYTLIRKTLYQPMVLAPLPFLTLFYTIYVDRRFAKPSKKLSLERAIKLDHRDAQNPEHRCAFDQQAYRQPLLAEKAMAPAPYRRGENDKILEEVLTNLQSEMRTLGRFS